MPFLAALGAIGWPLIKWLVPALPAKATLYLIVALGLVASHGAVAGYVWFKGYEGRLEAIADNNAYWTKKIQEANEAHDAKVQAAIEAGLHEPDLPADRALRVLECRKSPTCRERGRQ